MNFLAHLYLCDRTDEALLGSLYGDFMKGYRVTDFVPEIQQGIRLHQYIDTFTDDHVVFRRSKRRIHPDRRRYAGVLIDIFYDHFLALHWSDYSSQSLEAFTQEVYRVLERHYEILPGRLKQIAPHLVRDNWLMAYANELGLHQTFQRLAQRIQRQNQVSHSLDDLRTHRMMLYQDFCSFFPELQAAVAKFPPLMSREELPAPQ